MIVFIPFVVECDSQPTHKGQKQEYAHSHIGLLQKQNHEHTHYLYHADKEHFRTVVTEFRYVKKVCGNSAHQATDLAIVIKGMWQALKMFEHISTQVALHLYAHNMAVLVDEKLAKALGFKIENGKMFINLTGYFDGNHDGCSGHCTEEI